MSATAMTKSSHRDQMIAATKRLRAKGWTYYQIGLHLNITKHQAWYWANHEVSRRSNNESQHEYGVRGNQSVWDWWKNGGGSDT